MTSILSSVRTQIHCQLRKRVLHCRACGMSIVRDSKTMPDYNHGLQGKGKGNANKVNSMQTGEPTLDNVPQGEVIFGIHPVSLALTTRHRKRFHRLWIQETFNFTLPSSSSSSSSNSSSSSPSPSWSSQHAPSLSRIVHQASQQKVPVDFVPKSVLTALSGNRPHQGVCLDASRRVLPKFNPQQLSKGASKLDANTVWLLLYNIKDPMNFGAILRSAYYLGVSRVLVPDENRCALSPVVSKASAGGLEVMNLAEVRGGHDGMTGLLQAWQAVGGQVVGTATPGQGQRTVHSLQDFPITPPILLIVGNEGSGVDEKVLDLCDTLVTIPSPINVDPGLAVHSLNVSVATGILLHWLRASTMKS